MKLSLLQLADFQKKHRKRIITASFYLLLLAVGLFLLKNIIFFLLLTTVTGVIVFLVNRLRIPFDLSPIFFGSVMVMHFYGVWHVILFLFFASVIPSILGGSTIDFISILSLSSIVLVSFLVFLTTPELPFVLITVVVYTIITFFITLGLTNELGRAGATLIVLLGVNSMYFIALGKVIINLGNVMVG